MVGRQTHRRDTVPMHMYWYGFSGVFRPLIRSRAQRARVRARTRARGHHFWGSENMSSGDPKNDTYLEHINIGPRARVRARVAREIE